MAERGILDKTFGAVFFLFFVLGIAFIRSFFRALPYPDFAFLRNGHVL